MCANAPREPAESLGVSRRHRGNSRLQDPDDVLLERGCGNTDGVTSSRDFRDRAVSALKAAAESSRLETTSSLAA